jgi:hypothetical protein
VSIATTLPSAGVTACTSDPGMRHLNFFLNKAKALPILLIIKKKFNSLVTRSDASNQKTTLAAS